MTRMEGGGERLGVYRVGAHHRRRRGDQLVWRHDGVERTAPLPS